jgi:uncharacterized protein YegJ (DUF2314 family)
MIVRGYAPKSVIKDYAPPSLESLQYFGRGLSSEQAHALQNSDQAFILEFAHGRKDVWNGLRTANELIEELARRTEGLVWDEETREIYTPDAWRKRRNEGWTNQVPEISTQTVIHAYNNDESIREITLGMSKMGLPDVVVEDSSWSTNGQTGNLINAFCQAVAEGQAVRIPGDFKLELRFLKNSTLRKSVLTSIKGKGVAMACLTLKPGKRVEGDPDNSLIELAADNYPGEDSHAKQDQMVSSFFGAEDTTARVRYDDQELLAASGKARAKLPELHKAFSAGLKPMEFIDVKAPFQTSSGGREWMWIEVTSWSGGKIKGLLQNDPSFVPSLRAGQVVEVREEDVFDYIRYYPDKHTEGNTTSEVIRKMDDARKTQSARSFEPISPKCENY